MTLRAKSVSRQWILWASAAFVSLMAYVALAYGLYGVSVWDVFGADQQRVGLPILALFALFAYETRLADEARRKPDWGSSGNTVIAVAQTAASACPSAVNVPKAKAAAPTPNREALVKAEKRMMEKVQAEAEALAKAISESAPAKARRQARGERPVRTEEAIVVEGETGEECYRRARKIPHLPVPTFRHDRNYLEVLNRAAELDYAPAMAKLGEYAMRRNAWIEAYYWMLRAEQVGGVKNVDATKRFIRQNWAQRGFHSERDNEYRLFTKEMGDIARAQIARDSGRGARK